MPKTKYRYRHDDNHPVYGQTGAPGGDVNIFTRKYGKIRRRLKGQAEFLKGRRIAELELLEEMGKLTPLDTRELARLRASCATGCNKV